jgi:hypothetical protein
VPLRQSFIHPNIISIELLRLLCLTVTLRDFQPGMPGFVSWSFDAFLNQMQAGPLALRLQQRQAAFLARQSDPGSSAPGA